MSDSLQPGGLPCPFPGDHPHPWIKSALQIDFLPLSHWGSPMEYYSVIKKNAILPFAATIGMDLEGIMLSEVSQTEKDKVLCAMTYVWNLKNKTKSE